MLDAVLLALVARLIGSAANLISPLIIAVALSIIAGNTVETSSARAGMRLGFLFTVSLVGVGFGVDLGRLRRLGGRPLALEWLPGSW